MIRIDAVWLATQPVDMRAGADRLLSMVVAVFGSAQAHHGYLFTNVRAEQTTFSIPITVCPDRVSVAP
ncbi:IS66 family insertion sequence element accessory protein TnpB [Azohydromonas australica]|uniref:IS66 family insertion sequence element accessory protein TnpB n=1 Tax=Azohydromonas australica TaxID=364039 RepID=UPI000415BFDA|nr:IS66 family insertion sequence element accessory protein TnpB [Azohydromonas australica]